MQVEFLGVRRIRKWGKPVYAIRLGRILNVLTLPASTFNFTPTRDTSFRNSLDNTEADGNHRQ
jgi:hypothetical protein